MFFVLASDPCCVPGQGLCSGPQSIHHVRHFAVDGQDSRLGVSKVWNAIEEITSTAEAKPEGGSLDMLCPLNVLYCKNESVVLDPNCVIIAMARRYHAALVDVRIILPSISSSTRRSSYGVVLG